MAIKSSLEEQFQDAGFLTRPSGSLGIDFCSYEGNLRGSAGYYNEQTVYIEYTDPYSLSHSEVFPVMVLEEELRKLGELCSHA